MCEPASHSTAYQKIKHLIPEQSAEAFKHQTEKWFIDMTAWGHTEDQKALREKISAAIDQLSTISFTYTNASGKHFFVKQNPTHWFARRDTGIYTPIVWLETIFAFKLNRMKDMAIYKIPLSEKTFSWIPCRGIGIGTKRTV